ncbi:hypothetical protein HPULCUR_009714 [Helicostylum pulchrum]|uniref:Uncharacterized protein n=1 Tax=Helicostylum pulchrum TaxID=562976 RepID=A0ABP9YB85_9FUNG
MSTRDYSDIRPKIDYYASLPPPPPYTSSLYTVDDRKQNFPIDQLYDPYGTNEALVSLQNVKDYLLRIQSLSPMHDATISPTDKNTDIKSNPINNLDTPSSVHDTQQTNTMITDFSINEGLERIGTTLQQLIDEAQASLSGIPLVEKPSLPPPPPPASEEEDEEKSQGFANYSYQYVQKRYMQSQEKISVAFEQLEQSIQTFTTPPHNSRKKKPPSFLHYSKYLAVFGTVTTIVVMLLSKYQNHAKPYKTLSILLFIISLYFKSSNSKESTIVNKLDKFIIRMLF